MKTPDQVYFDKIIELTEFARNNLQEAQIYCDLIRDEELKEKAQGMIKSV